jgi:hypothetical protein
MSRMKLLMTVMLRKAKGGGISEGAHAFLPDHDAQNSRYYRTGLAGNGCLGPGVLAEVYGFKPPRGIETQSADFVFRRAL